MHQHIINSINAKTTFLTRLILHEILEFRSEIFSSTLALREKYHQIFQTTPKYHKLSFIESECNVQNVLVRNPGMTFIYI